MPGHPAIRAHRVGGGSPSGLPEPTFTPAPRVDVEYVCEREGCPHSPALVPFAAEAKGIPLALECRCGAVARQEGAPRDARPYLEGYGSVNGGQASAKDHGIDPQSQLRKRRTAKEGEEILDEALRARWNGRAR